MNTAISIRTTRATATPIPAFAPVLKPPDVALLVAWDVAAGLGKEMEAELALFDTEVTAVEAVEDVTALATVPAGVSVAVL